MTSVIIRKISTLLIYHVSFDSTIPKLLFEDHIETLEAIRAFKVAAFQSGSFFVDIDFGNFNKRKLT